MYEFPPFCYSNPYYNVSVPRPSYLGGAGGAGASGASGASGANNGTASGSPPKIAILDKCFEPNYTFEITFMIIAIFFFSIPLALYIKNRNHMLIKYRQPKMVITASILYSVNCVLVPIIRMTRVKCIVNTWIITTLVYSFIILTYARYIKVYFIQRLNIFKLRFGNIRRIHSKGDKDDLVKIDVIKPKEPSINIQFESSTIKTGSLTKKSNTSSDPTNDSFGITDPILYFKRLNNLVNRRLTIILVGFPLAFLIIYNIIITSRIKEEMQSPCVNEHKDVGTSKLYLNVFIIVTSTFVLFQAYYKQKWDVEIKAEYTIYVVTTTFCVILMQLAVNDVLGSWVMKYRMYIFQILSIVLHIISIIEPLIKVWVTYNRKDARKLSQEEFLNKLSDTAYMSQIKEIATNTFCIENVLFFEAHCDLMNMIISYYSKKSGQSSSNSPYIYSDILHKNTLNPILHKPFDDAFKPNYEKVYNLYINEGGIASINIKSGTIKSIEEQMENNNYSYLMFNQAAEEIGDLLYNNIYPRVKEM